jgi:serine/threonine-protein kinase
MNPEKIGRYEIKSELGRGGMATVYKAYDPRFEREVALKVLPREMLHDPQFRVRFEREAKTIALLEHPAIVPVYDVGEEDGQPYFVMRYMTGGSLADRIKQGALSIGDAAKIIDRLAPGLDEAHSKGIIHRDLKPGNILFDRTGEPYVSDFGIAKLAQSQGGTVTGGAIIGTPAYMSPEQAQGDKVDGRSDIYALGVILYEVLTGRQPYEADTPMAVVVKHITDPVPHILDVNPNLPADLERVIEKAMAKNPAQRFSTCKELAVAISAVSRGETPTLYAMRQDATARSDAASRTAAAKTRMAAVPALEAKAAPASGLPRWLIPVGGLLVLGLVAAGALFAFGNGMFSPPAPTPIPPTATSAATTAPVIIEITSTPEPSPTATAEPPTPTATLPPEPLAGVGGADRVAFIANNDVWIMNIDGSDLKPLTNNQIPKSDLQWMPDGKRLVFLSGKEINTVDAETGRFDTIVSFPFSKFLEAFRLSPDGTQVAISLNRELFIVPFDTEKLAAARGRDDLFAMKGCLSHTGSTKAAVAAREFRWSDDGKLIAWLFQGVVNGRAEDLIQVMDITSCDPNKIVRLDEFPGTRFIPKNFGRATIPDFDWDGDFLFVMNTDVRNVGWGDLYIYNYELRKANAVINPVGGRCCYRDARWSPDKNYLFVAFQDINGAENPQTQFYYLPVTALEAGVAFDSIPLPEGFFKNSKEAPQPALHPAQP